ncbi:MAG TPA: hypothetical protein PK425_04790 [Syntrophales bacterium]|nr:hypothetical protein [Syntrophales bacterium]HPX55839.1 hypothetical protein [Syntrophales bacterium]HQA82583.1 hypothetical protein [Syntrophales bacterium]
MNSENQMARGESGESEDKVVVEPVIKSDALKVQRGILVEGRGKVISIGGAVKTVKPGDEVTFDETEGQDVLLFGKVLKILKESEIVPLAKKES